MSYLDKMLVDSKELVAKLEVLIAKQNQLVEKQKVIDTIADYYNTLHSWEEIDLVKLLNKIREL